MDGLDKDASRATEPIKTNVLVCHGADDPYVPNDEILGFQKEIERIKSRLANDLLCRCRSFLH